VLLCEPDGVIAQHPCALLQRRSSSIFISHYRARCGQSELVMARQRVANNNNSAFINYLSRVWLCILKASASSPLLLLAHTYLCAQHLISIHPAQTSPRVESASCGEASFSAHWYLFYTRAPAHRKVIPQDQSCIFCCYIKLFSSLCAPRNAWQQSHLVASRVLMPRAVPRELNGIERNNAGKSVAFWLIAALT
jgi:hypothetical protein